MLNRFLSAVLALLVLVTTQTHATQSPEGNAHEEAWVAYATSNYFPLAEVMIAGVHAFSTRSIVLVGVNADVPFSEEQYPRLIKKRIDVDLKRISPYLIKPQAILASGVEKGIYIDCDILLNRNCDALFRYTEQIEDHPLCPLHPDEAYVSQMPLDFFGITKRSMHYIHADLIVFSKKCRWFLQNWCDICLIFPHLGNPCYDETLLNVCLWKMGATRHLPTIDPYFEHFTEYLTLNAEQLQKEPYCNWHLFHGNKDPGKGFEMLQTLKSRP